MNSGTEYNIITQLHMTTDQYAYLATAFTVSFALFEVPMNLFIKKATPRVSSPLRENIVSPYPDGQDSC
jgi:hypothetical protein